MTAPSKVDRSAISRDRSRRGHVSESGRLSLPAALRRAVGLERGGPVCIELDDGAIRIRTMNDVRDRVRKLAADSGLAAKTSVADFLEWRAGERDDEARKDEEG